MSARPAPTSPALDAAREHDRAGRHDEAINTLARAARSGDLVALSALAHRLLVGDRAPPLPTQALQLLTEAAQGGEGSALARLAALHAAGALIPQDWPVALGLLGKATAMGDAGAQGQLRALAPEAPAGDDWAAAARRVRLEDWLRTPARAPLHERVIRVPDLFPPAACQWLIARAIGRLERARVYDAQRQFETITEMRSNTAANFDLASIDVVQLLLQARMSGICGMPMQNFEPPNVLHYDVGEQITEHYDFIDPKTPAYERLLREQGQRMVTFLLYLNDDYDGGATTFPELGISHKGTRGEGLCFINAHDDGRPDLRMVHTGSPPTRGEKWIVSQFIRNIRLRA